VWRAAPSWFALGVEHPVWHPCSVQTVYQAAGGASGLLRLAAAWHARVMADEVVSHAFSHGFRADHTERLAAYWAEALGGPPAYSGAYGDESSVVRMHSGNGRHEEMDRRAIACFDQALEDAGLAGDDRLRRVLNDYFAWATTTTMDRYPDSAEDVPDGLRLPRWTAWSPTMTRSEPSRHPISTGHRRSLEPPPPPPRAGRHRGRAVASQASRRVRRAERPCPRTRRSAATSSERCLPVDHPGGRQLHHLPRAAPRGASPKPPVPAWARRTRG
jgi:hemoglobin